MIRDIKLCFKIIDSNIKSKAKEYAIYGLMTGILFPLSIVFIERCIKYVELEERLHMPFYICLIGLIVSSFLMVVLDHRRRVTDIELSQVLIKNGTPKLIDKFNSMKYKYYDDANANDTISRMGSDPMTSIVNVYKKIIDCVSLIIKIYGTALIYFELSILLGAILFLVIGIQIYFGVLSQKESNKLFCSETMQERKLSYIGNIMWDKNSVFDLKINNSVQYIQKIQKEATSNILKERVKIIIKAEKYQMINISVMIIWSLLLLYLLIKQLSSGLISISLFVTLMGTFPLLLNYLNTVSFYLSSLGRELLVVQSFEEFINYEECSNVDSEDYDAFNPCLNDPVLQFDNVSFHYPGTENTILNHISFSMHLSDKIALVGENGSGKSTIIKLLCGLYEPTEGSILINGKNINELSHKDRNKLFSVVFQDYQNYSLTVRENVALGNIELLYDEEQINKAIDRGSARQFIVELPKGLETNLNHLEADGVSLSGGQWQRIAIARALMANRICFLLDEPTASMDPIAESKMYHNFVDIIKNQGAIIVSHRLASAKLTDKIIVLHKGEIIQCGSHEELLKDEGQYKNMFQEQASWYLGGNNE